MEPPENLDPANLAMPDERISCLICQKKFTAILGLKGHIQRVHLGVAAIGEDKEAEDKEGEDKDGEDEEGEDKEGEDKEGEDKEGEDKEGEDKEGEDKEGDDKEGEDKEEEDKEGEDKEGDTAMKANGVNGGNEEEAKEVKKEATKSVSAEEASLIEKMYYMMRRYGCQFCQTRFNNKTKLARHEGTHAQDKKPVVCPYCEKSYSRRDKLMKHFRKIHPDMPVPVQTGLSPPEKLKKEAQGGQNGEETAKDDPVSTRVKQITVEGETKFQCPECETTFAFMKGCVRHIKMFHMLGDRKVQCPQCPMSYNDKRGLYQHMHRKHPKGERKSVATPDISGDDSDNSSQGSVPSMASGEPPLHCCKLCPRAYSSAGSLWAHKKAKHPEAFGQAPSPLLTNGIIPNGLVVTPVQSPAKKDFNCPYCPKEYSNYMSLYMHKKTKHSNPAGNGIGNTSVLTPNGRREKTHQCSLCPKRYADIKGVQAHMEKMHRHTLMAMMAPLAVAPGGAVVTPVQMSPQDSKVPLDCPYCENTYSRRDKLNEHIRSKHPEEEVPKAVRSPSKTTYEASEEQDPLAIASPIQQLALGHLARGPAPGLTWATNTFTPVQRGKYKPKQYSCEHCGKRYSDSSRLQRHVELSHMPANDPWKDIGTGTDIVVKNVQHPSGFDLFRVTKVYSTGQRLKCRRFAPVEHNKFILTEHVDTNVQKAHIVKVSELKGEEGGQVWMMEEGERRSVDQGLEDGAGVDRRSELEKKEEREQEARREALEQEEEANVDVNDEDEVMVEPVFEDGVSENGEASEDDSEMV